MIISESPTLSEYKKTMADCMRIYFPYANPHDLSQAIDYSINKRYKKEKCVVDNTYTKKKSNLSLLAMADYIASKEPIVTAYGVLFKKHADVPNPMGVVVQQFLDQRGINKKHMFKFPKGSEDFEKYNLLQQLDKIDSNGIYGILGMYTSLLFNINVSTSITSQGRALISSATMMFESFLANNVKFGSLDEVLVFIRNVCREKRTYDDRLIVDQMVTIENCFAKIIDSCGYRWMPDEEEMDIIWRTLNNLGQVDINRIYYKNNLYEFCSNSSIKKAITYIMKKLESPFFNSLKPPKEIQAELEEFAYILKEYVYYDKMIMDRIDRCDNMIKSTILVSDTDSCIVSLDAWYRFVLEIIKDEELNIKRFDPINVLHFYKKDEFGDFINLKDISPLKFEEPKEHYDFVNDEIIESQHVINPLVVYPQDYLRYSIINIMAYVIDVLVNDYMEQFTKNNHSWAPDKPCKIILKNEFTFLRLLLTRAKKSYASLQAVQEGNIVPKDEQLDIKGIASMAKSSMSESTRDALKAILLEDILRADTIDQFRIIEKLSILESKIIKSVMDGSKEYYKPVTIKAISAYSDPMRIQGVTASTAWNSLKSSDLPGINLEERNAIDIAKVNLNLKNIEKLEKYPEIYENAKRYLESPQSKGKIEAIALPLEVKAPDWLLDIIDYKTIVNNNISGFVYDSVGIVNLSENTNYSNIIQL